MAIDTSHVDIRALIERHATIRIVGRARVHGVLEYHSNCPWCAGTDRFIIQPERGRYSCAIRASGCDRSGDAISFLRDYCNMSFAEALDELGIEDDSYSFPEQDQERRKYTLQPPSKRWQDFCNGVAHGAMKMLWTPKGKPALDYLRSRGLCDETIIQARLGYLPLDEHGRWPCFKPEELDVPPPSTGPKNALISIPDGITIPWFIGKDLWKIAIRCIGGEQRYVQFPGSQDGLYNADALRPGQPAMMVEGEFDCLSVMQEAGDMIACVATGSTTRGRDPRWVNLLRQARYVLQAFDGDTAGKTGCQFWVEQLAVGLECWWRYEEACPCCGEPVKRPLPFKENGPWQCPFCQRWYMKPVVAGGKEQGVEKYMHSMVLGWDVPPIAKDPNDLLLKQPNEFCTLREWVYYGMDSAENSIMNDEWVKRYRAQHPTG